MMPKELGVMAADVGQTGVRVGYFVGNDCLQAWTYPGIRGDLDVADQVSARVVEALQGGDVPRPEALCVGASGLGGNERAQRLLAVVQSVGISRVFAAHDSVSSYLGSVGFSDGVVIAAGTGTVALAVGPEGVARIDGWGHLLGDAGSAYWIGRRGLEAALRGSDGRGPETELTRRLPPDLLPLDGIYLTLQQDLGRVRRIAALAPLVTELSPRDDVCREIVKAAVEELAHTVVTGLRRVGTESGAASCVGLVGNVFRAEAIQNGVIAHVTSVYPAVCIKIGGDSLLGARRLADVSSGSSLAKLVAQASAHPAA